MVNGINLQVLESGAPPGDWSAQVCELHVVMATLKITRKRTGTIHTDSKYVWGVAHIFGKIWQER